MVTTYTKHILRNSERGLEYKGDKPLLLFPYPAEPGVYYVSTGEGKKGIRVVTQGESVTVPAEILTCYHYVWSITGTDEYHARYAPGIGQIKTIAVRNDATEYTSSSELVENYVQ